MQKLTKKGGGDIGLCIRKKEIGDTGLLVYV